ncbi:sirohydrochlorin cobaltochelatase [Marinisporobacter balticus]|uniref:Cobalamin biosynthesis Co2+ chelatase CbiK n=1 Tax=Marinisporobacter balticus TaxID=2018667 RepID=A0A4R2KQ83_9FIRM|nr:cobalamin biosynthesis Co2+ chelatase CbiK [Marinisporobacter balticus]
MKKFKILSLMLALILVVGSFAGCAKKEAVAAEQKRIEENKEMKKAIVVTSFGTSYADTRKVTIEAVEEKITKAFPDYEVRRAFTSDIIIKKLKERDNISVDTLQEALNKLKEEGFQQVIVQPLHIIAGAEYTDILEEVSQFNDGTFEKLVLGRPILTQQEDYEKAVKALKGQLPELTEGQAVVFMGHGTHHPANASYADLQSVMDKKGLNAYVGTVEGYPALEDVIKKLKKDKIKEVTLMPYMLVAGDHANNDMAGEEEDSWKTILKGEGFTVNTYLHGLGENAAYQDIYVEHVKDAIEGKGEVVPKKAVSVEKGAWQEGKKGLLVVSFGTSYADTRKVTIDAVEEKIAKAFPKYETRKAFTSDVIIKKLKDRDGILIDTPEEALKKMQEQEFEEVIVQPLHIMAGAEYNDLLDSVKKYEEKAFKKIVVGKPILDTPADHKVAVEALKAQLPKLNKDQAVVVMGHGTHHPSNASYACLQSMIDDEGLNVYVGTVEGYPTLEDVTQKLKKDNIKEVTLMPYMLVAGDHANNDMAGDEEDSWKTILKGDGFSVNTYLHGLGENKKYQDIYVDHAKKAIEGEEE